MSLTRAAIVVAMLMRGCPEVPGAVYQVEGR